MKRDRARVKSVRIFAIAVIATAGSFSIAALPKPLQREPVAQKLEAAALASLERDAAANNTDAQLELALAYDDGSAGAIDRKKAAEWYARAAGRGVGVAHLRLGLLLEEGTAGRQSYDEARQHYE